MSSTTVSKEKKEPEVGDELVVECKACKAEMHHVVTAVEKGVIKKVMCKGCNTTRVYRKPKAAKAEKVAAAPKARKTSRRRKVDWEVMQTEIEDNDVVDYQLSADFTEAKAIRHKNFGLGVILKVISDKQIEVVFKEQTKILVHNYHF